MIIAALTCEHSHNSLLETNIGRFVRWTNARASRPFTTATLRAVQILHAGPITARAAYGRRARSDHSSVASESETILDVDSEIANGRPDLGMPQEHMHCPQVTGALIHQRGLRAPE